MASGPTVTIKKRFSLSLIVLASVASAQVVAFAYLEYLGHQLDFQQDLMTSVTTHQMFGDMKHDGIQRDMFRLIDASGRGDRTRIGETLSASGQDIDDLIKTYDFVFR
jgi:hypothetical protein